MSTIIRDGLAGDRRSANAHEITVGFAHIKGKEWPIVRCRVSFPTGREDHAERFGRTMRKLIDIEFPDAQYEWGEKIYSEPSRLSHVIRWLQRLDFKLTHQGWRTWLGLRSHN